MLLNRPCLKPPPSKNKKGFKGTPKTAPTNSTSNSTSVEPTNVLTDEVKVAIRNKVKESGAEMLKLFWNNCEEAKKSIFSNSISSNGHETSESSTSSTLKGIPLISVQSCKSTIVLCENLVKEKKYEEAIAELNKTIFLAPLETELIARLYELRGICNYETKKLFEAIRDLTQATLAGFDPNGQCRFLRMKCYLDLNLNKLAQADYDDLVEHQEELANDLKPFRSQVSNPPPQALQKLVKQIQSNPNGTIPDGTSMVDAVKATLQLCSGSGWGYEELGGFLAKVKTSSLKCIQGGPYSFGLYLRDVLSSPDMEQISEVFTVFLTEQEVPYEVRVEEAVEALRALNDGLHVVHQIAFAMCFSLAWTPSSMWNLLSHLFADHLKSKFEWQRSLWKEYYTLEMERIKSGDDDVSYLANHGIGEIPPPSERIDFLYVGDFGASDFIRLHAVATAHQKDDVLKELEQHVPLNTFYVTSSPIIFALARDAMPLCTKFIIERGAEINLMDQTEETPLIAARVALQFRTELFGDLGIDIPIEAYEQTVKVLLEAGAKEIGKGRQSFFEAMHEGEEREGADAFMGDEAEFGAFFSGHAHGHGHEDDEDDDDEDEEGHNHHDKDFEEHLADGDGTLEEDEEDTREAVF